MALFHSRAFLSASSFFHLIGKATAPKQDNSIFIAYLIEEWGIIEEEDEDE